MSWSQWISKGPGRVLTKAELSALSQEVRVLSDQMDTADNDAWIDWAVDRLTEIKSIIKDSLRSCTRKKRDALGLRVIQGGAA